LLQIIRVKGQETCIEVPNPQTIPGPIMKRKGKANTASLKNEKQRKEKKPK
jgi:hypothetical protein